MKIIIIGAGHNALVCSTYLAKAGHQVTIYEKSERVGGLCINEELFKEKIVVSPLASWGGMLRPEIIRDLELEKYGFELFIPEPRGTTIFSKDKYYINGDETFIDQNFFDSLSQEEKDELDYVEDTIKRAGKVLQPLLLKHSARKDDFLTGLRKEGLTKFAEEVFSLNLWDYLKKYISNEAVLSAYANEGFASPHHKGTLFALVYDACSTTNGRQGIWGMVRGAMGNVTVAMQKAAEANGVKIYKSSEVKEIVFEGNKATGVKLENGEKVDADIVISGTDPVTTFTYLIPKPLQKATPALDIQTAPGKILLKLKKLPSVDLELNKDKEMVFQTSIALLPTRKEFEDIFVSIENDEIPKKNMVHMLFPNEYDKSLDGKGFYIANIYTHYFPSTYKGKDWDESSKKLLLEAVINQVEEFFSNIRDCIVEHIVITPTDLRDQYNFNSKSLMHLGLVESQLFEDRPYKDFNNQFQNFYICGSSSHPGGTVTGAPGYNCAKKILKTV